jgi:hypothetical protein
MRMPKVRRWEIDSLHTEAEIWMRHLNFLRTAIIKCAPFAKVTTYLEEVMTCSSSAAVDHASVLTVSNTSMRSMRAPFMSNTQSNAQPNSSDDLIKAFSAKRAVKPPTVRELARSQKRGRE